MAKTADFQFYSVQYFDVKHSLSSIQRFSEKNAIFLKVFCHKISTRFRSLNNFELQITSNICFAIVLGLLHIKKEYNLTEN